MTVNEPLLLTELCTLKVSPTLNSVFQLFAVGQYMDLSDAVKTKLFARKWFVLVSIIPDSLWAAPVHRVVSNVDASIVMDCSHPQCSNF